MKTFSLFLAQKLTKTVTVPKIDKEPPTVANTLFTTGEASEAASTDERGSRTRNASTQCSKRTPLSLYLDLHLPQLPHKRKHQRYHRDPVLLIYIHCWNSLVRLGDPHPPLPIFSMTFPISPLTKEIGLIGAQTGRIRWAHISSVVRCTRINASFFFTPTTFS